MAELEKDVKSCEELLVSTAEAITGFQDQIKQLQDAATETKVMKRLF